MPPVLRYWHVGLLSPKEEYTIPEKDCPCSIVLTFDGILSKQACIKSQFRLQSPVGRWTPSCLYTILIRG